MIYDEPFPEYDPEEGVNTMLGWLMYNDLMTIIFEEEEEALLKNIMFNYAQIDLTKKPIKKEIFK